MFTIEKCIKHYTYNYIVFEDTTCIIVRETALIIGHPDLTYLIRTFLRLLIFAQKLVQL